MIKPEEYRIGNWYRRIHGKGFTDQQVGLETLHNIMSDDMSIAFQDFEPIALTDDVFNRCGYNYSNENGLKFYWHVDSPSFRITNDINDIESGDFVCFVEDSEIPIGAGGLKYLHQLQNLHYLLTDTQLQFN